MEVRVRRDVLNCRTPTHRVSHPILIMTMTCLWTVQDADTLVGSCRASLINMIRVRPGMGEGLS